MIIEIDQFIFNQYFLIILKHQVNNLMDDLIIISKNMALIKIILLNIHLYMSFLKMIQLINYILLVFYLS